ncbi:MAG: succinate dehydrogenase, cytochrome b556 subunit [Xanthomonadaceae bacterium]|jgi:succinate dehydrogenase / fumarate reductase cytochrome b subunit|nr:succinate dehydrogenase, cytochrome b556 subunit [Xanthomonadaceae bacterium]
MSSSPSGSKRPLSPFMIGPYYRPQLTSTLSILHRITGVALSAGALGFAWWLLATAAGPHQHVVFDNFIRSLPGTVLLLLVVFSLVYHWLNGLRHLLWDAGWGLEIPRAYATGWVVVALSGVLTAGIGWAMIATRGAA